MHESEAVLANVSVQLSTTDTSASVSPNSTAEHSKRPREADEDDEADEADEADGAYKIVPGPGTTPDQVEFLCDTTKDRAVYFDKKEEKEEKEEKKEEELRREVARSTNSSPTEASVTPHGKPPGCIECSSTHTPDAIDVADDTDVIDDVVLVAPFAPVAPIAPIAPVEATTATDQEVAAETAADAPSVHCRNASVLAAKHPFPADTHCVFEEEGHKYTIFGKPVARSTTAVLGDFFGAFDPVACTNQFFEGWAKNARSQYYEQIHRLRAGGFLDDEIAARIRGDWTRLGEEASRLGTLLHLVCEYDCNGESLPRGTDVSEVSVEVEQYECFKASAFYRRLGLMPYRTELTVAWRIGEMNVCAGQIDALYVDKDCRYYIVDFKRVVAKHLLDPNEQGFRGAMGLGPAAHLADTHFQKYSLQTSIYNIMLHQTHGVDVGENMYLLRMHDDREAYELVKCADHRGVARKVLAIEHARLVAEDVA